MQPGHADVTPRAVRLLDEESHIGCPEHRSIICIVADRDGKPWESGRDNSPDWDRAPANVDATGVSPCVRKDIDHVDPSMRPTKEDYDRYIKLVEYGRDTGWDHAQITRAGPFAVADPGITFILMRADRDMKYLAKQVGIAGAVHEIERWATKHHEAVDFLWSPELKAYGARD